jgi:TatD DNase family protein
VEDRDMLFDTHCHLTDPAFQDDLDSVLERAWASGVSGIVSIASNLVDARAALDRIADGRRLWCTAGIHPHEAASVEDPDWDELRVLTADPRVVALGECGLDYHYDLAPREVQRRVFQAHIELAAETGLPLVVHSREAEADMTSALRTLPSGVRGVLHCFGGSLAFLDSALRRGWFVSVTGNVSFRRFDGFEWLRAVPEDRLMIETDAPYMAPVPHRGRRNEPSFVGRVADSVAAHRGESPAHVQAYTTRNARLFYGLS